MKLTILIVLLSAPALRAEGVAAAEMFTTALRNGDLATMETLLASGLDPNLPGVHGQTPLYRALLANQPGVVRLLLAHHADPNAPLNNSRFSATPLHYALEYSGLHMASVLISAGAQLDAKGLTGRAALQSAAKARHLDTLQFLIEKGVDVNARDAEGTSPLDDAVWSGSLDVAAILLAHGARLDEPHSRTGATPINEAAFQGNTGLVRYLLRFGPDLETADKRGYGPLENAIRMGKEGSALALLEAQPKERQTVQFLGKALETAVQKDEPLVTGALLRHGARVNEPMPSGDMPLDAGAAAGAVHAVQLLLENGADPNVSGRNGSTPLEEASLKGLDSMAGMLLDHGARVDQLSSASGTTALYAAASFGKGAVVHLLLERGANPALCGTNRKSPYQSAVENGFPEVAAQLRDRGGSAVCSK